MMGRLMNRSIGLIGQCAGEDTSYQSCVQLMRDSGDPFASGFAEALAVGKGGNRDYTRLLLLMRWPVEMLADLQGLPLSLKLLSTPQALVNQDVASILTAAPQWLDMATGALSIDPNMFIGRVPIDTIASHAVSAEQQPISEHRFVGPGSGWPCGLPDCLLPRSKPPIKLPPGWLPPGVPPPVGTPPPVNIPAQPPPQQDISHKLPAAEFNLTSVRGCLDSMVGLNIQVIMRKINQQQGVYTMGRGWELDTPQCRLGLVLHLFGSWVLTSMDKTEAPPVPVVHARALGTFHRMVTVWAAADLSNCMISHSDLLAELCAAKEQGEQAYLTAAVNLFLRPFGYELPGMLPSIFFSIGEPTPAEAAEFEGDAPEARLARSQREAAAREAAHNLLRTVLKQVPRVDFPLPYTKVPEFSDLEDMYAGLEWRRIRYDTSLVSNHYIPRGSSTAAETNQQGYFQSVKHWHLLLFAWQQFGLEAPAILVDGQLRTINDAWRIAHGHPAEANFGLKAGPAPSRGEWLSYAEIYVGQAAVGGEDWVSIEEWLGNRDYTESHFIVYQRSAASEMAVDVLHAISPDE